MLDLGMARLSALVSCGSCCPRVKGLRADLASLSCSRLVLTLGNMFDLFIFGGYRGASQQELLAYV